MIELAKKRSSNDNISVIAVFFKDPKQIITEYKSRDSNHQLQSMDFESANGIVHHLDDVAMADECATKVETLTMDGHHDFYFGKNGGGDGDGSVGVGSDDDFHSNNINTEQSHRSNGDDDGDKFSSNDAIDDFGPETDVDATDDNAISPISPSVSAAHLILMNLADLKKFFFREMKQFLFCLLAGL